MLERFKLTGSDGRAQDTFGFSVNISSSHAVVGARDDDDRGYDSGSAYLFDVRTGAEILKLSASDGSAEDSFGYSVGITTHDAVVGSAFDDNGGTDSGSAYIFDLQTGTQIHKLTASDA